MTKIPTSNPIVQRITQLRNEVAYSAVMGNYKKFKTASKEHAKLVVENYELAKQARAPQINAPLFTGAGMRILKIMILDFFRIKSPEEKELRRLAKETRLRNEADKFIRG